MVLLFRRLCPKPIGFDPRIPGRISMAVMKLNQWIQPEVIPGVEKFTESFTGEEQKPSDSQEKILEKRIADLKQLNEKQLLAEIKALKERAYR